MKNHTQPTSVSLTRPKGVGLIKSKKLEKKALKKTNSGRVKGSEIQLFGPNTVDMLTLMKSAKLVEQARQELSHCGAGGGCQPGSEKEGPQRRAGRKRTTHGSNS